ncbi:MAG: hypothetical protein ACX98W_12060 [bacterium]
MHRLWAIVGVWLALGAADVRADEVEEAIAAAWADSEAGRCEQAWRRLSAIEGLESRAALLAGQCQIRRGRHAEALALLDGVRAASDLTPEQRGDVELYRGVALFHLERYAQADAALETARGLTADEAQLSLYRGLIALRRGDPDRAAPDLESAARLAPATTEPVASYYAGLAWQGADERSRAREAFERVVELDPEGPWGREAARLLESTRLFPAYVRMSAGIEHDDNVRLQGAGIDIPPDDGGAGDLRGLWSVEAGVQVFSVERWTAGLFGAYSGSAHFDLTEFDSHYPTVGGWLDRRLGPQTHARAYYTFGQAWVDEDAFLRTQLAQAGIVHTWERAGTTELFGDLSWNDFRFETRDVPDTGPGGVCTNPIGGCGPIGVNEARERDRDGIGFGLMVQHLYPVPIADAVDGLIEELVLRGRYRVGYYDSQGDEWEHVSNRFQAGVELRLPFDLRFDSWAAYERRDFANPSTFPDREQVGSSFAASLSNVDRQENVFETQAELEKGLGRFVSVSARWTYVDNESNRKAFDFDRHIVGGYVNFRFD